MKESVVGTDESFKKLLKGKQPTVSFRVNKDTRKRLDKLKTKLGEKTYSSLLEELMNHYDDDWSKL